MTINIRDTNGTDTGSIPQSVDDIEFEHLGDDPWRTSATSQEDMESQNKHVRNSVL